MLSRMPCATADLTRLGLKYEERANFSSAAAQRNRQARAMTVYKIARFAGVHSLRAGAPPGLTQRPGAAVSAVMVAVAANHKEQHVDA